MTARAAATGTQIADEIHRSGRPVTVSVGEHVRVPRTYRGKDISWWMDAAGVMDERYDEIDDINRARSLPSLQLAGSPERRTVDINSLTGTGIKLIGRLAGINGSQAQFSGSLRNMCALADLKMNRLLNTIDEWASENGWDDKVEPSQRFESTAVDASPPLTLDLASGEFRTILWATGYRLAGCTRIQPQRAHSTRRWDRRRAGYVPDGDTVPQTPQVQPYRRRG